MCILLTGEQIAQTSPTGEVELARRIDAGGGIPRRSSAGFRSTGASKDISARPADPPIGLNDTWAFCSWTCACGRALEWDSRSSRWGCGACD